MQIYFSRINTDYNQMLPRLVEVEGWALWLKPAASTLNHEEMSKLGTAFSHLRGIIWLASNGGARTPRIKEHLRAFGQWPALSKSIVAQGTFRQYSNDEATYSDVAWVPSEAYDSVAKLLSRTTAGADSILSFIPDNEEYAMSWARIVFGLNWLWLCRSWVLSSSLPFLDADTVLLNYITLTISIGGAAGLLWSDTDDKTGLVLIGAKSVLAIAASQLTLSAEEMDGVTFHHWLSRGIGLKTAL
jgi:hypothetical protein